MESVNIVNLYVKDSQVTYKWGRDMIIGRVGKGYIRLTPSLEILTWKNL